MVGLHHSGVPRSKLTDDGIRVLLTRDKKIWDPATMSDEDIDWFANEGIRISRIVDYLAAVDPNSSLTKAILRGERSPRSAFRGTPLESNTTLGPQLGGDGVLRMNIPIEVRIGLPGAAHTVPAPPVPAGNPAAPFDGWTPPGPRLVEAVKVDQTNYKARNGYETDFLGEGIKVPLPTVNREAQRLYGTAVDDELARETYLEALTGAMYAGRLGAPTLLREVAVAGAGTQRPEAHLLQLFRRIQR